MNARTSCVEMKDMQCLTCGCPYSLPAFLHEAHRKYNEANFCPNGHENYYKSDADLGRERDAAEDASQAKIELAQSRREITELKGKLVELRHRCEQAEAMVANPKSRTDGIATDGTEVGLTTGLRKIVRLANGRFRCPLCDATYSAMNTQFNKHLRREHGINEGTDGCDQSCITGGNADQATSRQSNEQS